MSSIVHFYESEVYATLYRPLDGKFFNFLSEVYETLVEGAYPTNNVLSSLQVLDTPIQQFNIPNAAGSGWVLLVYVMEPIDTSDNVSAKYTPADLHLDPISQILRKVPSNFLWHLPRRHDGALTSNNTITLVEGEQNIFLGFDCSSILNDGDILNFMSPPATFNLEGVSLDKDIGKYGFDAKVAKLYANVNTLNAERSGFVTAEVRTTSGGPYFLVGSVRVIPRS
jgi:hypothetical protein